MNKLIKLISLVILSIVIFNIAPAFAENYPFAIKDQELFTVYFPAGTLFRGILQARISSSENKIGDPIELIMPIDLQFQDHLCFPKDTKIIGKIVRIERPTEGRNAFLQFVFEKLLLPEGDFINIAARISNKGNEGIVGGETTERIGERKVLIQVEGIGNCTRLVKYGPRKMGSETALQAGSEWTIILDNPLKLDIIEDNDL